MICEHRSCTNPVPPKHRPSAPERRFCSVACRNRAINEKHKTRETRDCSWCGKPFAVAKQNQRYCARPCRLEASAATPSTEQARFWSKVSKDGPIPVYRPDLGPCWIWTDDLDKDGYGVFTRNGGKKVRAHRLALGNLNAPSTDHLCRVRPCVRDSHLESVTVQVNTLRGEGLAAVNARKTHCTRGHLLADENLLPSGMKRGSRACRTCATERRSERYWRAKAERTGVVEHIREVPA